MIDHGLWYTLYVRGLGEFINARGFWGLPLPRGEGGVEGEGGILRKSPAIDRMNRPQPPRELGLLVS